MTEESKAKTGSFLFALILALVQTGALIAKLLYEYPMTWAETFAPTWITLGFLISYIVFFIVFYLLTGGNHD